MSSPQRETGRLRVVGGTSLVDLEPAPPLPGAENAEVAALAAAPATFNVPLYGTALATPGIYTWHIQNVAARIADMARAEASEAAVEKVDSGSNGAEGMKLAIYLLSVALATLSAFLIAPFLAPMTFIFAAGVGAGVLTLLRPDIRKS